MIVRELVTLIRFQMEKAGFINAENQTSKLKKALNSTSDAGERLGEGISAGLKKQLRICRRLNERCTKWAHIVTS